MSKPMIEAKLFRLDNFFHFLKKLNQYRDKKLLVSLSGKFLLELSKPDTEKPGDNPYLITGFDYIGKQPSESTISYMNRLFDNRNVVVKVYDTMDVKLRPMKALSIDSLMFKLATDNKYSQKCPQQNTKGTLIDINSLWRVPQLTGLAEWLNSYRDEAVNLTLETPNSKVYLKLEKPKGPSGKYAGDDSYKVVAASTDKVFESLVEIFSGGPVHMQASNSIKDESWCILEKPMPLEHFVMESLRQHDETKRRNNYSTTHLQRAS